ncbi:MAG: DNA alkylation repair protein [Rhizobiaceae bacterium]|nr:DNA alkylation repair protein [Rhizobiaceae bacterium]
MDRLSPSSTTAEIVEYLRSVGSEANRQGMARYGIRVDDALGVARPVQRQIARRVKRNHERAFELWRSGIAEARFVASLTVDPQRFTVADARRWAADFDSWDVVDGVSDLFAGMGEWKQLVGEFAGDEREFVRRTAFAMVAWAAVHHKDEPDATFLDFLALVEAHSTDARNFVRKAVDWALRNIGKRSESLNAAATASARRLAASTDRTARWIGRNALPELTDDKTLARIAARRKP